MEIKHISNARTQYLEIDGVKQKSNYDILLKILPLIKDNDYLINKYTSELISIYGKFSFTEDDLSFSTTFTLNTNE